jgi:hypothetical protein
MKLHDESEPFFITEDVETELAPIRAARPSQNEEHP